MTLSAKTTLPRQRRRLREMRRTSQLFFLFVFLLLFFGTRDPYLSPIRSESFLQISPLLALSLLLSAHRVVWLSLVALLLLLLTIPLGRYFCGWICPMGTIIDGSNRLLFNTRQNKQRKVPTRLYSIKYILLIAILAASLFSVQWAGILDPIALLTRAMTVTVFPLLAFLASTGFDLLFSLGIAEAPLGSLYYAAQKLFLPFEQPVFLHSLLIAVLFLAVLILGVFTRRFWCRYLCPLGALFAVVARRRMVQKVVDEGCTDCGLCARNCRMGAIDEGSWRIDAAECIECAECVTACPSSALSYGRRRSNPAGSVDLSRRQVLLAAFSGVLGAGLLRTARGSADPVAIRPPGAHHEDDFLRACVRCLACVKICESTGGCLQPALLECGLEGLWTPIVVPRMGYCEFNCTLCGQVCPSGAIAELSLAEKQQMKIGLAVFDKNSCIPWSRNENCLVCEEHCPLPQKAIRFQERPVQTADGVLKTVKLPYVDAQLCIGCGICENKCPVAAAPGIVVRPVLLENR